MSGKLKIGVFGGARGAVMINVLLDHPDAELTAVCDKYEPLLEKARAEAEKHGKTIATYTDFDEFIKGDIDAVVLANYADEHAPFAIRAMKAGKHVLSEVLPCQTMAEAVELIETVEETGMVYAYAENCCYMDSTFEMWRRYKNGDIGEVMYAEGEYVHDCGAIWPSITYGDRNHWRNRMHPNFYITHSIGPIFTITGRRPVKVVGFETNVAEWMAKLGLSTGIGVEMVTLDNGAVAKSIHGWMKREPSSWNFEVYGQKGMMESGRFEENKPLNVYIEGEDLCKGDWEKYSPDKVIAKEQSSKYKIHGGSDFFATHLFIQKILGRPDGEWSIDVYTAVDMGICGILAYRSALAGNMPIDVPDLRNKEERDKYRNDNACTDPRVAGDQVLPISTHGDPEIPDSVYDEVRRLWENNENAGQNSLKK